MQTIKFRAEVDATDLVSDGLDTDYYTWELDALIVSARVPLGVYVPILLDFEVDYDEEFISEEDIWFKIQGEFDRPVRTDGGAEY